LTYRHLRERMLDEVGGGLGPLRRVVQDGHRPRPLQEKATRKSWPQVSQYARAKPQARIRHSR
jgi:hypothetical protein